MIRSLACILPALAACVSGAPLAVSRPPARSAPAQLPESPVGAYGGITIGNSHFGDYEDSPGDTVDNDDLGWSLYAGYQLSPYFAVSTGYIDFGNLTASGAGGGGFTDHIEYDGFPLLLHGILPVHDRMAFFTTLGGLYWNQDVDYFDVSSGPFTADEEGTSFAYGTGFNLYLNDSETLGLHVQVTRFIKVGDIDATGHDSDITFASVGVMAHTP